MISYAKNAGVSGRQSTKIMPWVDVAKKIHDYLLFGV
jgi:hypothetical protein